MLHVPGSRKRLAMQPESIHHLPELHEKTRVFADRVEGGQRLAELLEPVELTQPLVLAVPAGGVPVAAALAGLLQAPLDTAVVSKITLPWNSEAGYGAVAFDGSYLLNRELIVAACLDSATVDAGIRMTREKVARRQQLFLRQRPMPELAGRDVIVVDDGLASGFTMLAVVAALRRAGADRLLLAVPTAHELAARRLAAEVEAVYCANLRSGFSFAVAAAYRHWQDVSEEEAVAILQRYRPGEP